MNEDAMDEFCTSFVEAYKKTEYATLKELLHRREAPTIYAARGMDLLDSVCTFFRDSGDSTPERDELSEILVNQIVEHSKPKESLITLLEHVETFGSTSKFVFLLKPVQKVLMKFEFGKRIVSLNWVLNSIYERVRKIPLPNYAGLSDNEKVLVDCSKEIGDIMDLMRHMAQFFEPFVSEVCVHADSLYFPDAVTEARRVLSNGLMSYYYCPLLYVDLHSTNDCGPKVMKYVRQLMKLLSEVQADFLKLLVYNNMKNKDVVVSSANLAASNLFYLLLCEDVSVYLPLVYSHDYLFECALPFIAELLEAEQSIVHHKGVLMLKSFTTRLPKRSLSTSHFALKEHSRMFSALRRVIIYDDMKDVRCLAFAVFRDYINVYSFDAQLILLRLVLGSEEHSGLKGQTILMIKDRLVECFRKGPREFLDKHFHDILNEMLVLKNGVETDLLDNSDQIFQSLNALTCFLLMDKENELGLKTVLPSLEESFLKALQKAIDLSKAHYELKLKELNQGKKPEEAPCDVIVCGQKLGAMSLGMQRQVVKDGITTFDLMQATLSRTNECLSAFLARHK